MARRIIVDIRVMSGTALVVPRNIRDRTSVKALDLYGLSLFCRSNVSEEAILLRTFRLASRSELARCACRSIGTAVFGGMVMASFVGGLFVPEIFMRLELMRRSASRSLRGHRGEPAE